MAELRPETYAAAADGMRRSAAVVLPLVFEHLGTPEAILDVGCGPDACWMEEARALGVESAVGLDVHDQRDLNVYHWDAEYLGHQLPLYEAGNGSRWPLVLCLEMAEHVSPAAGDHLIAELTRVADAVLWSAAIRGQTGDGHVNCQPVEYWHERFERHGWKLTDPFREALWNDAQCEVWYRQNLLLAVPGSGESPRTLVHPEIHAWSLG